MCVNDVSEWPKIPKPNALLANGRREHVFVNPKPIAVIWTIVNIHWDMAWLATGFRAANNVLTEEDITHVNGRITDAGKAHRRAKAKKK